MNAIRRKVIVVDDSEYIGKVIRAYLPDSEFEVRQAFNGQEGLQSLADTSVDLIVLDVNMPKMGGVEFLKRLAATNSRLLCRVLVLTARETMSEFFESLDIAGFMSKPCSKDDFVSKVREILKSTADPTEKNNDDALTVLCADGDSDVAAKIDVLLKASGYSTVLTSSGPATLEMAAIARPDLILLRETLSGMNGNVLARLLHSMPGTRSIPIVLYDDSLTHEDKLRLERKVGENVRSVVANAQPQSLLHALRGG